MPLYIDIHEGLEDATPRDIADAHRADRASAWRYGIRMRGYSFALGSGRLVCLMEAPDAECVRALHQSSHGLITDNIQELIEDQDPDDRSVPVPQRSRRRQ